MNSTLDFIESQPSASQRQILMFIHDLMLSYDGVSSKIRYRIPFYDRKSWVCYANPLKKTGVELVFVRANEFTRNFSCIDKKDRKQVAGITILNIEEIPDELSEVIDEAFRIDNSKYKSKRII